ncbi:metal ABC transporter solute-binding protein, Zn/Mn family [Candidatus Poriferisocius sp.]|uniref:metal ABC transporter solute-binding protein, Zn/Mn family n=1 Tax=Candidatus Poriferisocius sp. TaxID=3101276 RepID=UPI003B5B442A
MGLIINSRRIGFRAVLLLAALALVAWGCGNDDDAAESDGVPTVVVTTSIWGDVVANVVCDGLADVVTLIPTGGDPHAYQPSLQARGLMEDAPLVVANGLHLEEGLVDTLEAVEQAGTPVFHMADHVSTIEYGSTTVQMGHDDHDDEHGHDEDDHEDDHDDEHGHDEDDHEDDHDEDDGHDEDDHEDDHDEDDGHDEDDHEDDHDEDDGHDEDDHEDDHDEDDGHDEDDHEDDHDEDDGHGHAEDDGHGHAHGGADPHVWFDPIRVADALPALSQALATNAGLDAGALDECVATYRSELIAVDDEIDEILAPLHPEDRLLVTNHDALGYFADRYGFQLIGTVIPSGSTLAEANPAGLQELVHLIEDTGVAAIFSETTHSSDDAEALGRAAGVKVLSLNTGSLGPPDGSAGTYIGFIRTNAQVIVEGLG